MHRQSRATASGVSLPASYESRLSDYYADNLRLWDERVSDHLQTEFYDVDRFVEGGTSLTQLELDALGDVNERSLLHLQCHFGLDTLSWARRGARVTGVDFAPQAIHAARELARRTSLPGRFILSDIYSLPAHLNEQFDIVYTSYGVLKWLHDIAAWGRIVASFLRPGGTFYLVEFHPFLYVFDYETATRPTHSYFVGSEPVSYDEYGTYADMQVSASVVKRAHAWPHPVSRVIQALVDAGLRVELFREHSYSTLDCFPFLRRAGEQRFVHKTLPELVPILYEIRASRPESL